ncbi:MAG: OsmC family protein [Actinomycetota bacterium]
MARERKLVVDHLEGASFEIGIRDHRVVVDQPFHVGGSDEGPTPSELFVASVASCAAFYGWRFLSTRNLQDQVDVVARWEVESRPDRVSRIFLEVHAPGVPEDRMEAFHRVLRGCLVHNTLERGCPVDVELVSDRAVSVLTS